MCVYVSISLCVGMGFKRSELEFREKSNLNGRI